MLVSPLLNVELATDFLILRFFLSGWRVKGKERFRGRFAPVKTQAKLIDYACLLKEHSIIKRATHYFSSAIEQVRQRR